MNKRPCIVRSVGQLVSFVLPVYNEEDNIGVFFKELAYAAESKSAYDYEFIFVNDGSRDGSLHRLEQLAAIDDRVVIVNFSRNFGHQYAITAGVDYADGAAVIIMDTDLQDPPAVAIEFLRKWEEGYDVVYGQRKSRKDTAFKKLSANIYYRMLSRAASIDIPRNAGDFRLLDRKVVNELVKFREFNRFMRGLVSYLGFRQVAVPFDRDLRYAGKTSYSLKHMVKLGLDGILNFSTAPIRIINNLGIATALLSFLALIMVLITKLVAPQRLVPGWAFIVMSIFFVGGVQLIVMGVLGSYIGRSYAEVQKRPLYIVERVINKERLS